MSDPSSNEAGNREPVSEDRSNTDANQKAYFLASIRVILCLLPIWFFVSYGCAILFRDWLDAHAPKVGNASFGFWMSQQGSIICFILLLVVYAFWMNRLDRKFNYAEEK